MQPSRTHPVAADESDPQTPRRVLSEDHPVLAPIGVPDLAGRVAHLPVDPDAPGRALCNAHNAAQLGLLTAKRLAAVAHLPVCGLCWRVYKRREGLDG